MPRARTPPSHASCGDTAQGSCRLPRDVAPTGPALDGDHLYQNQNSGPACGLGGPPTACSRGGDPRVPHNTHRERAQRARRLSSHDSRHHGQQEGLSGRSSASGFLSPGSSDAAEVASRVLRKLVPNGFKTRLCREGHPRRPDRGLHPPRLSPTSARRVFLQDGAWPPTGLRRASRPSKETVRLKAPHFTDGKPRLGTWRNAPKVAQLVSSAGT